MVEPVEVKLARIEEGLVALRGELRIYHHDVLKPVKEKVDKHHTAITVLKRDRWWVSGLAGVVFSWLGLKFLGKG